MAIRFLNRLPARLRYAAAHPPWLPLLTLLLLVAVAGAQFVVAPRRQAAIDATEQQLARLERAARRAAVAHDSDDLAPVDSRRRLLERFPTQSQLNAELGRLIELATEQGLQLPSGDYRLQPGKDGLFDRYLLNLPVKGSYPQIRRYLAAVRREFPDLAIDDIALRRDAVGGSEIEAQLRFILFGRQDAS